MRGALLEVKSSLKSLTKHLDPAEQLQAVQKFGTKELSLPKNAARLRDGIVLVNHLGSYTIYIDVF